MSARTLALRTREAAVAVRTSRRFGCMVGTGPAAPLRSQGENTKPKVPVGCETGRRGLARGTDARKTLNRVRLDLAAPAQNPCFAAGGLGFLDLPVFHVADAERTPRELVVW